MLTLTRPWEFLSFPDEDPSRNDSIMEDDSANDSEASSAASNADKPLSAPPTRQSDGRKIRFSTWEDAFNYIQEWAKHHGCAVKLGRHKRRGKKPDERPNYTTRLPGCHECRGNRQFKRLLQRLGTFLISSMLWTKIINLSTHIL